MTTFHLDLAGRGPLHRRIYAALLARVRSGAMRPGERLPSSRSLAELLGISRTPVLQAYEQLQSEGWLDARQGSGTRVAGAPTRELERLPAARRRPAARRISRTARQIRREVSAHAFDRPHPEGPAPVFDLRFGSCDPEDAPLVAWRRLLSGEARRSEHWAHRYEDPAGARELREALAAHLGRARGVRCSAERIVVTSGIQQALDLLSRLLLEPEDEVRFEEPGHLGARLAFHAAGAVLCPLRVDAQGAVVEPSGDQSNARLYYVTPSHQFPLGGTLPLERRRVLLERARNERAWVIEDDYDGEFRYGGAPIPSLQGLDPDDRVIYLGTFSKTLMPSLRMGFAVLPPDLVASFVALKAIADAGSPTLEQRTLARLISEGHYARHLRRVARRHASRRQALLQAVGSELATPFELLGEAAGLHVALRLPALPSRSEAELVARAAERGVGVSGARRYYLRPPRPLTLLLGHAKARPEDMRPAVAALARAVHHVAGDRS